MRHLFSASLALGTLLAAGCPNSNTGAIPMDQFGAEFGMAACDAVESCAGPTVSGVFFAAAGGCDAAFVASYRNALLPLVNQGVARGTVTYSPTQARACVDAMRASPCTISNNGAAAIACQNVWQGSQPAGGACSLNEECGVNQFCSFNMACPGACQARRTAGQMCSDDRHCAAGLTCPAGTCVAPPMVGVACEGLGGCSLGLLCSGGQCRPGSEVLISNEGQACNLQMGPLCREGLSCVVDTVGAGGATFVCRARVAAGAACRLGLPAQCPEGQACTGTNLMGLDFDGTCAPAPAMEGASCDAISGCAPGFKCDGRNGCVRVRENGDTCETANNCASGFCTGGVCVAPTLCGA